MNFFKPWRSSGNRASSNGDVDFDLFSQLSYMSAVAASGAGRSRIFETAAEFPSPSAHHFREIDQLAQRLNYDYGEACRIVGQGVANEKVRSFLMRFSAALSSGEREDEFLEREAQAEAEIYSNRYERDLEQLRGWTYAWAGLVVSTTLIVIITLVSSMIFPAGAKVSQFVVSLMGAMAVITLAGAWFIYHISPKEVMLRLGPQAPAEQRLARRGLAIAIPLVVGLAVLLSLLRVDRSVIVLAAGLVFIPVGAMAMSGSRRIDRKDAEVATLFRSLGGITSAVGMTVKEGLEGLDKRSLPNLMPDIDRLCHRLGLGLKPDACWERFSAETGSETVKRSTDIFFRAISLGGSAQKIGQRVSFFATTLAMLRARRRLISSTFRWTSVGMHVVVVALLVFTVALVGHFADIVQGLEAELAVSGAQKYLAGATSSLLLFNFQVAETFPILVLPVVLVLSVANAFVAHATEGGYSYKFFFYLGMTLAASGVLLWAMPSIVEWLFGRIR